MSTQDYRFVFFGTPDLAVNVLNALERAGLLPAVVVTAPDRARGRGQEVSPSPVAAWAEAHGIEALKPATLKDPFALAELGNSEWDFFVVAMYNAIIPARILQMPKKGCLNVHPSLLPKFRGPSPILSSILADERTTGVSIMLLDEEMDHGPILAQARIEIEEADWPMRGSVLSELLSTEGGTLLAETIPPWMKGEITPEEQDHARATYTKKFVKEDARIDLKGDARQNLRKVRAFDASPRAFFIDEQGKRVVITEADIEGEALILRSVIPEGRKEMSYEEYLRGLRA
jgi:methionyl-tRNA formyltransferase